MNFLAKTWSVFVSMLKLMILPFKVDKQLGKQLHVTIKQINTEPSVIPHCHGDIMQPQQSSTHTLSQKSCGRKWIYQKWVEGEECKELWFNSQIGDQSLDTSINKFKKQDIHSYLCEILISGACYHKQQLNLSRWFQIKANNLCRIYTMTELNLTGST